MQIIGCDLHARQQTIAMLDTGLWSPLRHRKACTVVSPGRVAKPTAVHCQLALIHLEIEHPRRFLFHRLD
jgi:hypothetical protein